MTRKKSVSGGRQDDNGGLYERDQKRPVVHWLVGATSSIVLIAIVWGILITISGGTITLPGGFKFESNDGKNVEVVVLTEEEKEKLLAGTFTKQEKHEILNFVRKVSESYATMKRADITLSDLIKHQRSTALHVYNQETLQINPVIKELQDKIKE